MPIGNAGNVTAIMSGFLKMLDLGMITGLPRIFGVQSEHADPVWRYYDAPAGSRCWQPVTVQPSVAQAAMIGNPVSSPRVRMLARAVYGKRRRARVSRFAVTQQTLMNGRSSGPYVSFVCAK